MTLALLVPGLRMGGGPAAGPSTLVLADLVHQTWSGTGTGSVTPDGTVTARRRFDAVMSTDDVCYASITSRSADEWEVTTLTMQADGSLARAATPIKSSNGNALVDFGTGVKDVLLAVPASALVASMTFSGYSAVAR